MKKTALSLAVLVLTSAPALAQSNTTTATGSAQAQVIGPINLTHTNGTVLSFGSFTAGTGGTVTIDTAGAPTAGGNVVFVGTGTPSADGFSVSGEPNRTFTFAVGGGTVQSGAASMAFTTIPSATSGTLNSNGGGAAFTVGGTLTVASAQAPGQYVGSYTATATYN